MPRLSTEFLETEALSPSTGQIIYRDDDLLGFGIRVTPKAKSYIVEKRFNGVNRRITIGRFPALSADEARVIASKTLSTMAIGIDPKTGKRAAPSTTLREVFDKYITVRRLRTETLRVYQGLFRNNFSDWLDKPIVSITKDMIQERHKTISSGTSKGTTGQATADNACKLLQSVLNFANEHYADEDQPLFKVNPVSRLSRDKQWYRLPPRSRIIPDDKLSGWYQAVRSLDNVTAQDYFLTLLFTGFRKTEAMSLTWDDIDLNRKIISIPAHVTKSNRTHVVPMCDFLYELLRARHSGREKENNLYFLGAISRLG